MSLIELFMGMPLGAQIIFAIYAASIAGIGIVFLFGVPGAKSMNDREEPASFGFHEKRKGTR